MKALLGLWCRLVGHVLPPRVVGAECGRCGRLVWRPVWRRP